MIRNVRESDCKAIAEIYNAYVTGSTISFETDVVSEDEMGKRISNISSVFPYLVYETDGQIAGYCYAHAWKERAAYKHTLETTVYLNPQYTGKGIGYELMLRLISECRKRGIKALVACITYGNEASIKLHTKLKFKEVSHFEKVGYKLGQWLDVSDYELLL